MDQHQAEEYLCQLVILNHVATADVLTALHQDRFLASITTDVADAAYSGLSVSLGIRCRVGYDIWDAGNASPGAQHPCTRRADLVGVPPEKPP